MNQERQRNNEIIPREQLQKLRSESVFGHGQDQVIHFPWQESAAVFDAVLANGHAPDITQLHEIFPTHEWRFSMQVATPQPQPEILKGSDVGITQANLIDAVDQLPKLVGKIEQKYSNMLQGLLEYGLKQDNVSNLLRKIIYDYRFPDKRLVKSWRLDMVGGDKISEAQIAAGGWVPAARIAEGAPHFVGNGLQPAKAFVDMLKASSEKNHPTGAIYVDKGLSGYWPEWNDFRLLVKRVDPSVKIFAVGNNGFRYNQDQRKLYYVNEASQAKEPIDTVYTFADARRLLQSDAEPLLQAIVDGAVSLEPTLNPLLNNYHLIRAFLFHEDPAFINMIAQGMHEAHVGNSQKAIEKAKNQTIPMSLVDKENMLDLGIIGEQGKYAWENVVKDLADTNNNRDGAKKIIGRKAREKLIVRVLLSEDLGKMSGGRGSRKLSDYSTQDLIQLFQESLEGIEELKQFGRTSKTIVGVEPLIKHEPRSVTIYDMDQDGNMSEQALSEATQRCCPSYVRPRKGDVPKRCGTYSYYSGRDGGYKLGRSIYAIGAHY